MPQLIEDTDPHLKAIHPQPAAPRITAPLPPPISPIPAPHPSFPSFVGHEHHLPCTAKLVAGQIFEKEWLCRTFIVGFGDVHCIATAPYEVFCLFLNQLRFPCVDYKESAFCPWKARYPIVCALLSKGYVKLARIGEEESPTCTFYLLPAVMVGILTCADLAREQRFDTSLCCHECHNGDFRNLNEIKDTDGEKFFTSDGGPEGRVARVCCRAWKLLPTWYLGKKYAELPECLL